MAMQPRPHQLACLERVKKKNTIVNMPTGTGKTLVAVLTIEEFRDRGKVIFLVPTRPLVDQQANYVRTHSRRTITVKELEGAKTDHLSATEWQFIVKNSDVLVGTAEVFRRALVDTKFLSLHDFSLLIFDECHNAIGNSPMAGILRDAVHRSGHAPRILGLTASFVHGALKDIEKKRKTLEGLLQATIFCPDVEERPMNFERVFYNETVLPAMSQEVENRVQALLSVAAGCGVPLKETKSVIRRGVTVFSELGLAGFIYYLRECVVPQVQCHIEKMNEVCGGGQQSTRSAAAAQNLPKLRQTMRDAADRLSSDGALTSFPFVTDKAKKLLDLVKQLQAGMTRIIVFCEEIVVAHPLAHLLQKDTGFETGSCTGVGSMSDGQRKRALERFRSGEVPIMTCTAALEEGLDVSECEVVVRFSSFKTTKSHIQGSGRARAWNARVFYFDNDPGKEIKGADLMERTAKADSLSLTGTELQERRKHADVVGVHPYQSSFGAEISIFNCVPLVYEYASRTMGQSFRPEETMLRYVEVVVCPFPLEKRRQLASMTLPSPNGFFEVDAATVDKWWGKVGLDDVAEKSRMKNWNHEDKEVRRHAFVAAVELSRRGYLDANNQPTQQALHGTRKACAHWHMTPGARIGVKFDQRGLSGGNSASASADTFANGGLPTGYPIADISRLSPNQSSVDPPAAVVAAAKATAASLAPAATTNTAERNFKGFLNEKFPGDVKYETVPDGDGGFRSTVRIPGGGCFFSASASSTKKAAEQSAAEAALRALDVSEVAPSVSTAVVRDSSRIASSTASSSTAISRPSLASTTAGTHSVRATPMPPALAANNHERSSEDGEATTILAHLLSSEVISLNDLVQRCGLPKMTVNHHLYELQRRGSVTRIADVPPVWAAAPQHASTDLPGQSAGGSAGRPSLASTTAGTHSVRATPMPPASAGSNHERVSEDGEASTILAHLLSAERISLNDLVQRCGLPKTTVNRHLYELQRSGSVSKVADVPPVWAVAPQHALTDLPGQSAGGHSVGGCGRGEDLASQVLALLRGAELVALDDIVRSCGATKKEVNRQLCELQKRGAARKVVESPPTWACGAVC
eukprot:TRINITY_DN17096_c0_g2_i1.p1 TRINITY_DN17096_c0_g2~~TRINITY_DN17096_c0_g2_i1.p1  ORF type:complete len:1092 (+),score=207.80 TRINITY_DN17096_c0_g2_i1:83-3358(+)